MHVAPVSTYRLYTRWLFHGWDQCLSTPYHQLIALIISCPEAFRGQAHKSIVSWCLMLNISDFLFSPLEKTGVQTSVRHRLNARLLFLNMETKTRQIEHPVIYLFICCCLCELVAVSLTDITLLAVCADIKEQLSIAGSGNTLPSSTSWHQRMLPLFSFVRTRTCSRLKLSYEWNWIDFYLLDVRGWKPYFPTRVIGFVTSFLAWEGGRPHLECRALAGNLRDVRASEVALVGERGWCCGLGFVWVVVVLTLQNSDKASPFL